MYEKYNVREEGWYNEERNPSIDEIEGILHTKFFRHNTIKDSEVKETLRYFRHFYILSLQFSNIYNVFPC